MHVQSGGVWGGCSDAYNKFSDKWSDVLDSDMTDDEITAAGYDPGRYIVVTNCSLFQLNGMKE